MPRELRDDALDRTAGRELHDDEADQHDPEQRRDDQQQALREGRWPSGGLSSWSSFAAFSASYHQVSIMPAIVFGLHRRPRILVPVGDIVRRPYTSVAPNSGRRAARGRGRGVAVTSSARRLGLDVTLSIRASTAGSLMPARLKLPSIVGRLRAPEGLELDARRQPQRVALDRQRRNRTTSCAARTAPDRHARIVALTPMRLQVLDVGAG